VAFVLVLWSCELIVGSVSEVLCVLLFWLVVAVLLT